MSLILVDGLKDRPGTGGPKFPNGLHLPAGIGITGDGHINMAGVCTFSGNVTIGGTLTYEDVTNIDSVGVVTARSGVNVSGGEFKVGTAITVGSAGVSTFFGVVNLNRKTTVNATLEATEGLAVTAGVGTFDCDRVRIVRNAGPILELTTNANTADSSIHLLEGSAGSTTNGGAVVYSGAGNRLGICCGTTLTTEKISVLRDSVSVGVGTINPARHLHLHDQSSDTVQLHITNSTTGVSGSDGISFALGSDESLIINQRESNKILFKTADTDRVSITSGGDVELSGTAAGVASCTWDASANSLIFNDNSKAIFGTSSDGIEIYHNGSASYIHDSGTGDLNLCMESGSKFVIQSGTGGNHLAEFNHEGAAELFYNGSQKFTTTNDGVVITGICTDSLGNVRDIPLRSVTGSAATLVVTDAGKVVSTNTTGWTVPASTFSEGDTVSLLNNSAGGLVITCSAVTTYLTSDGTTVTSKTLGARGMATLYFVSSSVAYLQGTALS